ncbi:uncharacterized protein At3g49140-like isoform X3 [Impatiens glandulifera]|uniref:uncharacterized protein At3g49140-like isoform X2 n=1 Tax=Impatiens glandulifera TaxID=253017 RepID=UPI001FB085DD|nr:uncharacterized protein At3g49140-like isoform X2 [Impatiens glandulifera]XP_047327156.1 uncharacterized protein At3g49140-like isoform X3 [Impatiens glandulifera]
MLMLEAVSTVRFSIGGFDLTSSSRRLSCSANFVPHNKFQRLAYFSTTRRKNTSVKYRIRASADEQSSPIRQKPSRYHPFEEIDEPELVVVDGEARLTPAETARTIIEVNSKATLMFSGLVHDEIHENIFWPDLPYMTDEHGNIYFQVKNDEDILQNLASEDNLVQVIIGLDTAELLSDLELSEAEIDISIQDSDEDDEDDDDEEDGDDDDDESYNKDWVSVLEDEDEDSDESVGDWAKLETMRSSHPMNFAKKLAQVVSDDSIDYMDQPPDGLSIQGLLRPAFIEEHSIIHKHLNGHNNSKSGNKSDNLTKNDVEGNVKDHDDIINGHKHESGSSQDNNLMWAEELDKDEPVGNGTTFYKLEMIKIQLISAHGNQILVEVTDFRKAQPDAIAHSSANILSRLKAGGEKTTQALKALCWRCKGIQAEEATLVGIDTLGFELRVCAGRQVETFRFAFNSRASSEYSAERQLNDVLFPRTQHNKTQKKKEAQQTSE